MTQFSILGHFATFLVFGTFAAGANTPEMEWQFIEYRDYSHPAVRSYAGAEVVREWADNGFIIGGGDAIGQASLVKLSTEGAFILRTNYFGGNYNPHKVNDLTWGSDGSLVVAGDGELGGAPEIGAAFVFQLSPDLDLTWWRDVDVRTYKNSAKQVTFSPEGQIAIETGWWIIKLAAEGAARLSAPAQSADDIAAEGFRLTLSGEPGTSYVLERSADLIDWTPNSTNLLTESEIELRDSAPRNGMNFYRARTEH